MLESGFLDWVQPGESVMADRGFQNLEEQFLERGARLIVPPSMSKKKSLSLTDEHKTRSIALRPLEFTSSGSTRE